MTMINDSNDEMTSINGVVLKMTNVLMIMTKWRGVLLVCINAVMMTYDANEEMTNNGVDIKLIMTM